MRDTPAAAFLSWRRLAEEFWELRGEHGVARNLLLAGEVEVHGLVPQSGIAAFFTGLLG